MGHSDSGSSVAGAGDRGGRARSSLACRVSAEKSADNVMGIPLYATYLFFNKLILFIYFCLRWVFVAACGLSPVAASRGCCSLWSAGFSLRWLLFLWSVGSRCMGFSSCGMRAQ